MEWRCEWCGKPHADDDPPCDNCGHGSFEEAVVRMGPAEVDGTAEETVWACTECGREHQKHSPPCSRCGNATLEQRERDYSDLESVGSTGWLDILDAKYAAGFAAVALLAVVLGLGMAGVVDLPAVGAVGAPDPPDAPGSGDAVDGLSLSEAEAAMVEAVNADRERAGQATLARGATLDAMATYYTKRRVEAAYADADEPSLSELDPFEPDCSGQRRITVLPIRLLSVGSESFDSASQLGKTVADNTDSVSETSVSDRLGPEATGIGVDIHVAPDDDIYATVVSC